jgi:hypothetical protein
MGLLLGLGLFQSDDLRLGQHQAFLGGADLELSKRSSMAWRR